MGYQPIEELLERSGGSIYRLVRMAANRALELAEGKPRLIKHASEKSTTVALEEIRAGKVVYKEVADKKKAKKTPEKEELVEEKVA